MSLGIVKSNTRVTERGQRLAEQWRPIRPTAIDVTSSAFSGKGKESRVEGWRDAEEARELLRRYRI